MGDFAVAAFRRFRVHEWFLAFRTDTGDPIARFLTRGQRFRHVSCFGFVHPAGCWTFYDWNLASTMLSVVPEALADEALAYAIDGATIVRFVPPAVIWRSNPKLGFWCVTSVAHLTGVRSSALRPDALFRDCVAQGGTIIAEI